MIIGKSLVKDIILIGQSLLLGISLYIIIMLLHLFFDVITYIKII